MLYRIAAATSDEVHVDGHFGRCRLFTILEAEDTTGAGRFVGLAVLTGCEHAQKHAHCQQQRHNFLHFSFLL